jgi:ABC-2 type transport system ATP-binding protein
MTAISSGQTTEPILQCHSLCKTFGTLAAVQDVSLALHRGQILGLVGPNGAGKTTLMRMLATLLHPTQGSVWIAGQDASSHLHQLRRHIGYLPDFFNLHRDLTLRECLNYYAHAYDVPRESIPGNIEQALSATGLLDKRDDFVRHLSRGMVQRLGMAMLMTRNAEIMILDEPASGLDPTARVQFRHILKALGAAGKAILISSHILNELEDACTHIAIMDRGRLLMRGTVNELRQRVFARLRYQILILGDTEAALPIAVAAGALNPNIKDGHLALDVTDETHIAQINAQLVRAGIAVTGLRLLSNLEDAFMKITSAEDTHHVSA